MGRRGRGGLLGEQAEKHHAMQNNKTNKESPNKREIRTPTRYNDFDTTAVPGQRRPKEETNDKPSYNGGKDTPSPQPKTGGHSMIKNSTKLQKERMKEGLDTHAVSVRFSHHILP